jgi:DNA-binding response OmpR family regulator
MKDIKKILLIVEDDLALSKALVNKFSAENFNILEAKNGEEGLEIALKDKPALILLDIVMPRMDGITMLKKLREDTRGKDIPVIFLTNLTDAEHSPGLIDENVVGYLVKTDWSLEDIVKKVKSILK